MLTELQIQEVQQELVKQGTPVRFLINGQATNIITGTKSPKGSNVIYHQVYWNFTKETSNKIATWINAKPIFDKD